MIIYLASYITDSLSLEIGSGCKVTLVMLGTES